MKSVGHGTATSQIEDALRKKDNWREGDGVPEDLWTRLKDSASRAEFEGALIALASKSISAARMAAAWVASQSGHDWSAELAVAIARHLPAEARSEAGLLFGVLRAWATRDKSIARKLLTTGVIEASAGRIEVDLLWVCEAARLQDPDTFALALRRASIDPGAAEVSLSGVLFAGIAGLPPAEDVRIRALLRRVGSMLEDLDWLQQAREAALLDIIRDFLNLAVVLACRRTFLSAFAACLKGARSRPWSGSIAANLAAPLVLLKDVSLRAPWLEEAYLDALQAYHGDYGQEISEGIRSGYYRNLRRNPVIEKKQEWRRWWDERAAAHGAECVRPACEL